MRTKVRSFLTLQVAFAFVVTLCLSGWQLNRGFEKLVERDEFRNRLQQPPLDIHTWQRDDALFRHIELRGTIDQHRMYLVGGNRHAGQTGFWVYALFDTESGRFLVNRGWIAHTGNVQVDPKPPTPVAPMTIHGVIWPKERSSNIPTKIDSDARWPIRLPEANVDVMATRTGAYAQEIRLIADSPGVLEPAPLQMEYATAMHWGYAFQWLLIGVLLVAGYWYFVLRPKDETQE